MSEKRWYQVPSDLTPRLHIEGGPAAGTCGPSYDPNKHLVDFDKKRGEYVRHEDRGGAYWKWYPYEELA